MSRQSCALLFLVTVASSSNAIAQIVDHNAFASVTAVSSQTVRLTVGSGSRLTGCRDHQSAPARRGVVGRNSCEKAGVVTATTTIALINEHFIML